VTGYTVSYKTSGSSAVEFDFLTTEATLRDLVPSTTYTITVTATNAEGDSSESAPLRHSTDDAPPEAPSVVRNVQVSEVSSSSLSVTWVAPSFKPNTPAVDSYRVSYAKKDLATGEFPAAVDRKVFAPATSTLLQGLDAGSVY
jgi:hypothetical protein